VMSRQDGIDAVFVNGGSSGDVEEGDSGDMEDGGSGDVEEGISNPVESSPMMVLQARPEINNAKIESAILERVTISLEKMIPRIP